MISEAKQRRLVAKLIRLTGERELNWHQIKEPDVTRDKYVHSSAVFEADVNGVSMQIRQVNTLEYVPGNRFTESFFDRLMGSPNQIRVWRKKTILDIVDPESNNVIESLVDERGLPILENLFDSVMKNASVVDSRIDAFLGEQEPTDAAV